MIESNITRRVSDPIKWPFSAKMSLRTQIMLTRAFPPQISVISSPAPCAKSIAWLPIHTQIISLRTASHHTTYLNTCRYLSKNRGIYQVLSQLRYFACKDLHSSGRHCKLCPVLWTVPLHIKVAQPVIRTTCLPSVCPTPTQVSPF